MNKKDLFQDAFDEWDEKQRELLSSLYTEKDPSKKLLIEKELLSLKNEYKNLINRVMNFDD